MSKYDLDEIKEHLEHTEGHQRAARRIAENVGDKSGAAKIQEAEKKSGEVRKEFDKDL